MARIPKCGHPDRRVFSGDDCKSCAQIASAKRSQERRRELRSQGVAPTRINNETELTNTLRKIYNILSAELKPLHPVCEGRGKISGCTGKATTIHHKKGRRGFLLILSKFFGYLCEHCHDFCTENSDAAKTMGLSLRINSKTVFEFTDRELELIRQYGLSLPKDTS